MTVVLRRYRFLGRPGWLVFHAITLALAVTMVLLGRWQLDVSNDKHFDLQNFGYAIQWWLFTAFGLFMWCRVVRDAAYRAEHPEIQPERAPGPDEVVPYRRYVMPSSSAAPDADPMRSAYNDYLAGLAAQDKAHDNAVEAGTRPSVESDPQ